MRLGSLEVQVIREDGTPFGEVVSQGRTYIVARPGESFSVSITMHGVLAPTRVYRNPTASYRAACEIDGHSLGHSEILKPSQANADGDSVSRKKQRTEGLQTYKTSFSYAILGASEAVKFRFADTAVDEESARVRVDSRGEDGSDNTSKVGTISVYVDVVHSVTGTVVPDYKAALPEHGLSCSKGVGKKALLAPTLSTAAGETVTGVYRLSSKVIRSVFGSRVGPLVISYQTESVLLLRKILDPTIPEHLALTSYANMANGVSDDNDEEEAAAAGAAGGRQRPSSSGAPTTEVKVDVSLAEGVLLARDRKSVV